MVEHTAQEILDELKGLLGQGYGPEITLRDFRKVTGISGFKVYDRWGTWTKLRVAAGLPRRAPVPVVYSDDELLREFHIASLQLDHYPTAGEFGRISKRGWGTLHQRFGRKNAVLESYCGWCQQLGPHGGFVPAAAGGEGMGELESPHPGPLPRGEGMGGDDPHFGPLPADWARGEVGPVGVGVSQQSEMQIASFAGPQMRDILGVEELQAEDVRRVREKLEAIPAEKWGPGTMKVDMLKWLGIGCLLVGLGWLGGGRLEAQPGRSPGGVAVAREGVGASWEEGAWGPEVGGNRASKSSVMADVWPVLGEDLSLLLKTGGCYTSRSHLVLSRKSPCAHSGSEIAEEGGALGRDGFCSRDDGFMAALLQIRDACKSYGSQVLLDHAEATISEDVKVGFVGRNGAGKSTLLRILLGEEELDSGSVTRHPNLRLGYLRQHDDFRPGESALEFLMRDSGQPDWKCGEVAGQFELKGSYLDGPISKLSGGWQTRVKLAALLLHEPNLLLLDEPTNFLDLRTQILLEHFLRGYNEACLIVSHDRAFLGATCSHTLDLTRGKLTMFPGKIDAYLEYEREQREVIQRSNASVLAKRKNLEEFIAKNKARASTATQARSKSKQLERLEVQEVDAYEATAVIRAPQIEPRQGPAVRCKDMAIGYPERKIAGDITLEIDHGSRAAIVGDNGQGKTTFLRTIVDSLKPLEGELRWGHGCSVGVYAQHVYTTLPPDKTVLQHLEETAAPMTRTQTVLDIAGAFLFRGPHVEKKISVLSGGERARLCLAGMLLSQYNILVLDEPGNHLDVDTVEALADALVNYKGTVIFTTHDRHFMKRVATCVIEVKDGRVTNYNGDYEAYVYAVNKEIDDGEREANAGKMAKAPAAVLTQKAAKPKAKDDRALRKELQNVERSIAKLDEQKKALSASLANEADAKKALELHNQLEDITKQLTTAEEHWCEIQEELGEGW